MDTSVILVTLIGVVGTLGGVWLGYWLQEQNTRRQRDWMLEDQKREWVRKHRQDTFDRTWAFVEGILKYLSVGKVTLNFGSSEEQRKLIVGLQEQWASSAPVIHTLAIEDKQLDDLVQDFSLALQGTKAILDRKNFNISDTENSFQS